MSIKSFLLAGLIAIISQTTYAQQFIQQDDLEGNSFFTTIDAYDSKIIVSGAKAIETGIGAKNHTFVYDEVFDSTYVLDAYELNGIWKQELKDSLILLLDSRLDRKFSVLVTMVRGDLEPDHPGFS